MATCNEKYANLTVSIDKKSLTNITVSVEYELKQVVVFFTFSVPKDKNDISYERVIIRTTTNLCKLIQGVVGDFFIKMFADNLRKSANFELKCPVTKGVYNFYNIQLDEKFLPTYLLDENLKYSILAKVMGKIDNHKNLQYLFTLKSFGIIRKD